MARPRIRVSCHHAGPAVGDETLAWQVGSFIYFRAGCAIEELSSEKMGMLLPDSTKNGQRYIVFKIGGRFACT